MGNATKVYFYREAVMLSKEVWLESSAGKFSLSLETFINACVAQVHQYAREDSQIHKRDRISDILDIAEAHILPGYSSPKQQSLNLDGMQEITTFERAAVFDDIKKMIPKVSSFLQLDLYTWVRCDCPRFPRSNDTLFRLLVRSIARRGMFFVDKEEMEELMKAAEPMMTRLGYDLEWKDIIKAHRSEEYDLALFHSYQ